MSPLNSLELRLRVLKDDRLPMAGERTPVSRYDERLNATTRRRVPRRHLTPSQLQYPPVVLLLRFHEASGSPPYPPPLVAAALKASSAASSSSPSAATSVETGINMEAKSSSKHTEDIAVHNALVHIWGGGGRY